MRSEPRKELKGQDAVDYISDILQPVSGLVAATRCVTNGIVFVIHKPSGLARKPLKKAGLPFDRKGTTVLGMACPTAAQAWGHDLVTRMWCEVPPVDGQIKVFLIVESGTLLVTLDFEDGNVNVSVVPDIYLVK